MLKQVSGESNRLKLRDWGLEYRRSPVLGSLDDREQFSLELFLVGRHVSSSRCIVLKDRPFSLWIL